MTSTRPCRPRRPSVHRRARQDTLVGLPAAGRQGRGARTDLGQEEHLARLVDRVHDAAERDLVVLAKVRQVLEPAEGTDAFALRQEQLPERGCLDAHVDWPRAKRTSNVSTTAANEGGEGPAGPTRPALHIWGARTGALDLGLQILGAQRADGLDGGKHKGELFLGLGIRPRLRLRAV